MSLRSRKAGWYIDPSDRRTQRYFDGTQWTEHHAPALPAATHAGSNRGRLAVIAGMLAVSVFFVVCAVTDWNSRHSGVPARVHVSYCSYSPSPKTTDWCWGDVLIDGEATTRRMRFLGPTPDDVGETLNARVHGDDVTITDVDLFRKLLYPVLASSCLVATGSLAVRAVRLSRVGSDEMRTQ